MSNNVIEYLDDHEYVLLKPEIYVGTVEPLEIKTYGIDETKKIFTKTEEKSIALYKLFSEIFDNSIDILKRVLEENPKQTNSLWVKVLFDERNNKITITDNGSGFEKATDINKKTGITNIETAYCKLRAGSNFRNKEKNVSSKVIGTNGVGASLVNILSDEFYVKSTNKTSYFEGKWVKFLPEKESIKKKGRYSSTGTSVSFIPRSSMFGKFDFNTLLNDLSLKVFGLHISKMYEKISVYFDYIDENGVLNGIDLKTPDFDKSYYCKSDSIIFSVSPKLASNEDHMLMVNSTICDGSIMKLCQEAINQKFGSDKSQNYYTIKLFVNLPPELVAFGDQNKTKYSVTKAKIQGFFDENLLKHIKQFQKSEIFQEIHQLMNSSEDNKALSSLDKDKKKNKKLVTNKYFAPSKKFDELYIVEGDSAKGSILQNRNSETQGVYALKGKVLNCDRLQSIKNNKEVMDLITILDLDFHTAKCKYNRVVIAADADPDGYHIVSLIINLFYLWFKPVIDDGKLFIFNVPLFCTRNNNKTEYYYNLSDLQGKTNVIYLKGLGSLDKDKDWPQIMSSRKLTKVNATDESGKYVNMAFGNDSDIRKLWLSDKNCLQNI